MPLLRTLPVATVIGVWLRFREEFSDERDDEEVPMRTVSNGVDDIGGRGPRRPISAGSVALAGVPLVILVVLVAAPLVWWYGCRIEPGPDRIAVLIRKTGKDLSSGKIVATDRNEKGVQLEVLAEGRHFRNPYTWAWETHPIIEIPAGKLGVQTRLYGDDLPPGEIMATATSKGILAETLGVGKHRVNPYAIRVDLHDALTINAGCVGVKTALVGADVLSGTLPEDQRNTFLVGDGLKGVVSDILDPGTYYLNPYLVNVVEVNLQSQRFEMSGDDAITFLTLDGFSITVEGTIEFGIERSAAALVTHRVGDMEDTITKVIMPRARGFSRTEGSKYPAIDFIVGETRQRFQKQLEEHLRTRCTDWGVAIKSVLVRKIVVPDEIASISRDREVAVQDALKFAQQIEQAKSKAELVKQETLAVQNKVKVETDTERIRATIEAQQDVEVKRIAAERELGVAKITLKTAEFQAQATLLQAEGERAAVAAANEADATVVRTQVAAFGGGLEFARYAFRQRVAPRLDSVLTSDRADGLGGLFGPLLATPVEASRKEVAP
jgi:regulator of protease activity HflC (stomatin/prohibitin superfamily)